MSQKETANTLKAEIQKTGLKLSFVAEKTHIPYDSLIQYLNGHRPIPDSKLQLICLTCGIDEKIFGLHDRNSVQKPA